MTFPDTCTLRNKLGPILFFLFRRYASVIRELHKNIEELRKEIHAMKAVGFGQPAAGGKVCENLTSKHAT